MVLLDKGLGLTRLLLAAKRDHASVGLQLGRAGIALPTVGAAVPADLDAGGSGPHRVQTLPLLQRPKRHDLRC